MRDNPLPIPRTWNRRHARALHMGQHGDACRSGLRRVARRPIGPAAGTGEAAAGVRHRTVARVPNARGMTWGERGTLFVGSNAGKVYAVTLDARGAVVRSSRRTCASRPAWRFATARSTCPPSAASCATTTSSAGSTIRQQPSSSPTLSDGRAPWPQVHRVRAGWQAVRAGRRAVQCLRARSGALRERHAHRSRGGAPEIVARGVRNSVGFAWHPVTGDLWFTDNGRDNLGDDVPPDELNRVTVAGQHFGFPYCHAGTIPDPEFGRQRPCSEFTAPAQRWARTSRRSACASTPEPSSRAVSQPGLHRRARLLEPQQQDRLPRHPRAPRRRRHGAVLRAVRRRMADNASQDAWGRPADVLVAPDGSLLVSDDPAGAIYRIRYRGDQSGRGRETNTRPAARRTRAAARRRRAVAYRANGRQDGRQDGLATGAKGAR